MNSDTREPQTLQDPEALELLALLHATCKDVDEARNRMPSTKGRHALKSALRCALGGLLGAVLPDLLLPTAFALVGIQFGRLAHIRQKTLKLSKLRLVAVPKDLARVCALVLDDYCTLLTNQALAGAIFLAGVNLGALLYKLNQNIELPTSAVLQHGVAALAICCIGGLVWLNICRWGVKALMLRLQRIGE